MESVPTIDMGEITESLLVSDCFVKGHLDSGRRIGPREVGKDVMVMIYLYVGNESPLPKEGLFRRLMDSANKRGCRWLHYLTALMIEFDVYAIILDSLQYLSSRKPNKL